MEPKGSWERGFKEGMAKAVFDIEKLEAKLKESEVAAKITEELLRALRSRRHRHNGYEIAEQGNPCVCYTCQLIRDHDSLMKAVRAKEEKAT